MEVREAPEEEEAAGCAGCSTGSEESESELVFWDAPAALLRFADPHFDDGGLEEVSSNGILRHVERDAFDPQALGGRKRLQLVLEVPVASCA